VPFGTSEKRTTATETFVHIGRQPALVGHDWFRRRKSESANDGQPKVKVYLNPLHAMLHAAEKSKGSLLSAVEVLRVRDTTVAKAFFRVRRSGRRAKSARATTVIMASTQQCRTDC
jgi:hypothetical protein